MNRDHVPLTEAEWKIMLLLWEKSPRTMMELTRALAEDTGWSLSLIHISEPTRH